ncbi:FR1L4 protein, partial [Oenanthe oenanthe]|nr:FR1L4 protein [Oenanthe oenanthe]
GSIELKLHDMVRAAKSSELCTVQMAKGSAAPRFSIFRNKRMRGWWPFIKLWDQADKREERHCGSDILSLQGKVEAEFQLLTVEEADKSPVGLGRKGPE